MPKSQALNPVWSQPRSLERQGFWGLLDESQHSLSGGRAGLEAEVEGHELGEGIGMDEVDSGSVTEPESDDTAEWFVRVHPELTYGGKAPLCKSSDFPSFPLP